MMDYEIFKEVVAEKMPSYLPGELKGREVMIHPVDKINQTVDGLILKMDGENEKVSPTIYLNDMYEHYKQFGDLQLTLQTVGEAMLKSMAKGVEVQQGLNFDNPEEKIVFQLINTEQNKDMLAHVPHREWKDLSIIYRLVTNVDKDGIESAVVRDGLAEKLGLTEEQLFKHAVENTRNIFPPTVRSMNDVMKEIFMADGMPMEAVEMILGEVPADRMMYVISNDRGINGAISCYIGFLQAAINFFFQKNNKEIPKWLIGIYALMFIGANLMGEISWYSILAILACLAFIGGIAQKNGKKYRRWHVVTSFLWCTYDILTKSYEPLVTHIIILTVDITGIVIHDLKLKKGVN